MRELKQTDATSVPGIPAQRAPHSPDKVWCEVVVVRCHKSGGSHLSCRCDHSGARMVGGTAVTADDSDQALSEETFDGCGEEVGRYPQVDQPRYCAQRVISMKCRENQVSGHGCLDGDIGRLGVSHLSEHDDVGVLAENRSNS